MILQDIWVSEILEKQYFPDNLKLAYVTPVYKKNIQILVESDRPVSALPSVLKLLGRIIQK